MKRLNENYFEYFKKNFIIKLIISIVLSCLTLCTCFFCNNSFNKEILNLSFDLSKIDEVIVDKILINGNEYIGTDEYSKYVKYGITYYFDIDTVTINCNSNDSISIEIPTDMKKYVNVSLDGKELNKDKIDDTYVYFRDVSKFEVLYSQYALFGIFNTIFYITCFIILYLFLLTGISFFIDNIKNNKFNFISFIFSMFSIFIIYYLNFHTLISLLNIWIIVIIVLFFVSWTYRLVKTNRIEIHNIFLLIICILSISYIFVIPPFNVPDEGVHFIKAYDNLFYLEKSETSIDDSGHYFIFLSNSVDDFYHRNINKVSTYDYKTSNMIYFKDYAIKINKNNLSDTKVENNVYKTNKFAYIPANIAIFFCKAFNVPVLFMFYFARFINSLIFIILTYFAVKIVPKYKYILIIVSTFPITLQQSIGINQDSVNNAIFIFAFAYILTIIYSSKKITKDNVIVLYVLSIFLSLCKVIYTPIILLSLLVKNKRMGKPIVYKTLLLFFVIIITILSYIGYSNIFDIIMHKSANLICDNTSNYYTVDLLLKSPIDTIRIYLKTTINNAPMNLLTGLYNGFGWLKIWLSNAYLSLGIFGLYLVLLITQPFY